MENTFHIATLLKKNIAVFPFEGEQVYKAMSEALKGNDDIVLDFSGLEHLGSGFLHGTVGQTYRDLGAETAQTRLKFSGINGHDSWYDAIDNVIKVVTDPEYAECIERRFDEALNLC